MRQGKFICTDTTCKYKKKRTTISPDGISLTNGVDCNHLFNVTDEDKAPPCPFCKSEMVFEPYDFESIAVAKFSAQNMEAKRASLIKRRENFNKSPEGRAMRAKAEYYQGALPSK